MTGMLGAAGYSDTPLARKLGLKDGQRVLFIDLPQDLGELAEARDYAEMVRGSWGGLDGAEGFDLIHAFTASRAVLERMQDG